MAAKSPTLISTRTKRVQKSVAKMGFVHLVGLLALLVIAVAIWMAVVSSGFGPMVDQSLPGGFKGRGLAMQFAITPADVQQILGPDVTHNREIMRKIMMIDFLWIACYGLLYAAISRLLIKRNCPWARYLGLMALIAGLAAGGFDIQENRAILKALDCMPCDQSLITQINNAALLKWAMTSVAIALLAIAFQDLANRFANWISISFIVTAFVGFAGLWRHPLLMLFPVPLLIGLTLLVITAFFRPSKLKESIC